MLRLDRKGVGGAPGGHACPHFVFGYELASFKFRKAFLNVFLDSFAVSVNPVVHVNLGIEQVECVIEKFIRVENWPRASLRWMRDSVAGSRVGTMRRVYASGLNRNSTPEIRRICSTMGGLHSSQTCIFMNKLFHCNSYPLEVLTRLVPYK